jgi:hypothetical protein
MKRIKISLPGKTLFAVIALAIVITGMTACSKKSNSSKSSKTALTSEPVVNEAPPAPAPVEEKEGMQIKRDAAGNYVIHLLLKDLQPVKLMKPVKEGYVVWTVDEANVPTNVGNIEGANTWTDKKDKVIFEATTVLKPAKVFITAETDLKTAKPGTQVVWSTRNY